MITEKDSGKLVRRCSKYNFKFLCLVGDLQDLVERQEPGLDIYRETAQLHAQLHQVLLYRKTAQVHQVLLYREQPSLMPSYTRYSSTGNSPV